MASWARMNKPVCKKVRPAIALTNQPIGMVRIDHGSSSASVLPQAAKMPIVRMSPHRLSVGSNIGWNGRCDAMHLPIKSEKKRSIRERFGLI
jgi:hypothetical protein